jgi:hypothetical protein
VSLSAAGLSDDDDDDDYNDDIGIFIEQDNPFLS